MATETSLKNAEPTPKKSHPKTRLHRLSIEQYKSRCSLTVYGYIRHECKDTPPELIPLIFTFYYLDDRFIKVFCRFRPQNKIEQRHNSEVIKISDNNTIVEINHVGCKSFNNANNTIRQFTFDYIFEPSSSQTKVYNQIGPQFIDSIFAGYNTSILAYGQTTAGKTYTIEGENDYELKGFMPRIIENIFEKIETSNDIEYVQSIVKASFIEIYLEKIRDLLIDKPNSNSLKIRERKPVNGFRNIYIENISEHIVQNASELLKLIADAKHNRMIAHTHMSTTSSRAHGIFMIELTQKNLVSGKVLVSKIKFCDLCGSEKIRKNSANGQLLKEARCIGQSLNGLGCVISSIVCQRKHVPYRDSKLTRLLANELGGNCNTFLIINCSPSSWNVNETVSSCRFGVRAKKVINCPCVNTM